MKKLFAEFKTFVMRGNVMDLAVAVIIGAAFQAIVTSLSADIITPLIQFVIGKITGASTIEEMTAVLNVGPFMFGNFASAVINFLIMAVIIFLLVKVVNKVTSIGKKEEKKAPTTKKCPFCCSEIDIKAVKCPHCTSDIPEEEKTKE